MTGQRLEELQREMGYSYKNKELLLTALTHSSFANEKGQGLKSNERLEFLGDSVLGFITAEFFFRNRRELPEGELTKLRAVTVCEKSLYKFAREIGLGKYLRLGNGEENSGGRERASILADAFEAVIASVYLDGGIEAAKKFVLRFAAETESGDGEKFKDYKTELQELIQKNPDEKLSYVLSGESGPDHDKLFEAEVHLNSKVIGRGRGRTKKLAEQEAAREALSLMEH